VQDDLEQQTARSDALEQARQAYDRRAWRAAHTQFADADAQSPLGPEDLERYARTAVLTGDDEKYVELLGRASQLWAAQSDWARAAECSCYLALNLSFRGQSGPASGWWSRAKQQVDAVGHESPALALLTGSEAIQVMFSGDPIKATAMLEGALAIARRCGDRSVAAFAGLGIGQCLVDMGEVADGLRRLDEVMVSVITDELNPVITGIIYCAVINACQEGYDARRAGEWTLALTRWCEGQPDLVPFRGQCLVHRAQIMQLRGHWPDAMEQIDYAREHMSEPPQPAIGSAYYEQAELCRLRGDFVQADQAYELAASFGHEPQPGLALLRVAQGKVDQAQSGISRALQETDGAVRPRLLAAAVEVAIAADDLTTARANSDELVETAADLDSLLLTAMAEQAMGTVLMASGHVTQALPTLRRAWRTWQELEAPYFAAQVRALVGRACRELSDLDAARMEFEAARAVFDRLGAQPDLDRLREWGGAPTVTQQPAGLTAREVEVLRQVASGKTNRVIATELFLSEKTVARHISNIFGKLQVSSRAAATGFAYEHDLV
jgi:DNA-binding CsgD family transcriptional regulator/tetratricopeptide (TPR) repeat protein